MARFIPRRGKRLFAAFFCLVFSCALGLSAQAFDLRLNGILKAMPAEARLRALSYPLPSDKNMGRGLSLAELLPPLIDVWKIECAGATETRSWKDAGLADMLGEFQIIESSSGGWDFWAPGGARLRELRSISVSGDPAQERELEIWLSWEGVPELKAEIERWAFLTGTKPRIVEVPDTRSKLLAVMRGGGRVPDLVMIQSDAIPDLLGAQALQPLDRIDPRHMIPKGLEAFATGGHLWAMPFYFDTQLVFFNKALIPSPIPLDWTTDDLVALAAQIRGKGKSPIAWNVYSAYWLLPFALGFGKPAIADVDGGVRPDDPGTKAAVAWIRWMIDAKYLEPLERDAMVARFASGETAMILSGSYSIPEFQRIGLDFGVAPYPLVPSTGKPVAPLLDFKGFAMTRSTRSPVTARRLIEHLSDVGVQQRFATALSKLPANRDAWKPWRETSPYYAPLAKSAEIGAIVPPSAGYSLYKNTMWKILRFILSGSMKPEAALAEARRLIDANLTAR